MIARSSGPRSRHLALLHFVLLLALLPQPLQVGHWELPAVDIPLTGLYLALPAGDAHSHTHTSGEEHARHCHEGASACGNFSAAAGLTIPILAAALLIGLAALAVRRLPLLAGLPPASRALAPLPPPPRLATCTY